MARTGEALAATASGAAGFVPVEARGRGKHAEAQRPGAPGSRWPR
ncbi:MAG TPA: hypothetical protein VED40_01040 [Azospirillaceae bacterium]|nr:hypothetical protein [Azospirillaceae bacterium]